jgi:hypothetical protein
MICIFCQQTCTDLLGVCYNPTNQCSDVSYTCKPCKAEFVVEETRRHQVIINKLVKYWISHEKYRLFVDLQTKHSKIEQKSPYNGLLGITPDLPFIWDTVIEFDYIPAHVTPDNVESRIKTLLTFL